MANIVTLDKVEQLASQLPRSERLKLVAHICKQLSVDATESDADQVRQQRLRLAEELLAECEDIEDDSQGEFDAVGDLRRVREGRLRQICQSGA
ncbi:MAG: hypothetical protein ACE5KT_06810 [Methanosarcinales archaeon]